jgi:hypothetical protein
MACKGKTVVVVELYLNKKTILCLLAFYCNFVRRWVKLDILFQILFALIYDSI